MSESRLLPEAARLLPMVLENLPVGVWIMNASGQIIYGNAAGQRIWAGARYVGPEEFGEYKGWWAETGEPIAAEEWAGARAILHGETSIDELIEIECFDGTHKTILNSALPVRDPEGVVVGALILNHDITDRRKLEQERERLVEELQEALSQVKTLSGLLPICASCRKIRDDQGGWSTLEKFVETRTDTEFTHGICPECLERLYPEHAGGADGESSD